jgi:hypothetical protein
VLQVVELRLDEEKIAYCQLDPDTTCRGLTSKT